MTACESASAPAQPRRRRRQGHRRGALRRRTSGRGSAVRLSIVSSTIAKGRIAAHRRRPRRAPCRASSRSSRTRTGPHVAWLDRSYDDEVAAVRLPVSAALRRQDPCSAASRSRWWSPRRFEAARDAAALVASTTRREAHNTDFAVALAEALRAERRSASAFRAEEPRRCRAGLRATRRCEIAGEYHLATEHHNPMEMHATTVIWEGDGRITVYDKTQGSQNVQAYLAGVFGFCQERARAQPVCRRRLRLRPAPAIPGLPGRARRQEARALGARRR